MERDELDKQYINLLDLFKSGFVQEEEYKERIEYLTSKGLSITSSETQKESAPISTDDVVNTSKNDTIITDLFNLLNSDSEMRREGIKPDKYGFLTFVSVCKTSKLQVYEFSHIKHSVRNNPQLFILRHCPNSGKLQIKSSATPDLLIENEKPPPSKHQHKNRRGIGTKNWIGFPIPPSHVNALREASQLLGRRLKLPHFSLGWCKTETAFFNTSCENIDDVFRNICAQMSTDFILRFSHYSVMGKYKDKIAVIFKPVSSKDGEPNEVLFTKYSNDIFDMWRNAGKNYAKMTNGRLRIFRNDANTLEYGEVNGRIIFEMRAINLKFHVTIGKGTEKDFQKLSQISFPDMFIIYNEVYVEAGKTSPFTNI